MRITTGLDGRPRVYARFNAGFYETARNPFGPWDRPNDQTLMGALALTLEDETAAERPVVIFWTGVL